MFFSLTAYPRRLHTVPVLYSRALFVCSKGGSLRLPKLPVHPSPSTSVLAVTSLFAKSMSLFLLCKFIWIISLDSTYKWCYVILVFVWFTSLSIIISRSIPVAAEGIISFFFDGRVIFRCIYVPQLLHPLFCQGTFRLLPCPGCCEQRCSEHWGACILSEPWFSPGIRPVVGMLDLMVPVFSRTLHTVPHSGWTSHVATGSAAGPPSPHPSSIYCLWTFGWWPFSLLWGDTSF